METQWPQAKINGSGRKPTPPWLWLLMIGLLALIFWQFVPKNEVQVLYYPWFVGQVESGNIKTLKVQGNELHGELRTNQPYLSPSTKTMIPVRRFFTSAPSEDSIQPIVETLIERDKKTQNGAERTAEPTLIDVQPPNSPAAIVWIMLLLPTVFILAFIYFIMRKARIATYGGTPQGVAGAEEKIVRAEAAFLEAAALCRETGLPDEQRRRLETAISELQLALKDLPQPEV
jgi:cell division protease FtsH